MKTRVLAGFLVLWLIALLCVMVGVGAALGRKGDRAASTGAPGIAGRMAQPVTLVDVEIHIRASELVYLRAWSDGTIEIHHPQRRGDGWSLVAPAASGPP